MSTMQNYRWASIKHLFNFLAGKGGPSGTFHKQLELYIAL